MSGSSSHSLRIAGPKVGMAEEYRVVEFARGGDSCPAAGAATTSYGADAAGYSVRPGATPRRNSHGAVHRGQVTHPFVVDAFDRGDHRAGGADAGDAVVVVRQGRRGGVVDDGDSIAEVHQPIAEWATHTSVSIPTSTSSPRPVRRTSSTIDCWPASSPSSTTCARTGGRQAAYSWGWRPTSAFFRR